MIKLQANIRKMWKESCENKGVVLKITWKINYVRKSHIKIKCEKSHAKTMW